MKSKNFDFPGVIECMQLKRSKYVLIPNFSLLGEVYRSLLNRKHQIILECGVNRGLSTSIFTYYCENSASYCFSIDIKDCSDVVTSDSWTFIKNDDSNVSEIIKDYPILDQKGIDILFIDSLHTANHVKKVLYNWYPYLNKDSLVFIDDIDSANYRKGNRKDNLVNELNLDEINEFTRDFVQQNYHDTSLTHYYGKTGLARISKISEKGSKPEPINKRVRYISRNRSGSDKRFIGFVSLVRMIRRIKNVLRVK